jgi:uncharacterized membrane protein YbhN (UPF0104 family)
MALGRNRAGRPPRWFRVVAAVTAVVFPLQLISEHSLNDTLWAVVIFAIMALNAIAPRGLYDGRFNAWMQDHPLVNGGFVFLILGAGLFSILSDYFATWLCAAIAIPVAAGFAVFMVYRSRSDAWPTSASANLKHKSRPHR